MKILLALALLASACGPYIPHEAREQLKCLEACQHFAGTFSRRELKTSYPMPDKKCACTFEDDSTEICARRLRKLEPYRACY